MEANNGHGYLHENHAFDDIMQNTWPGADDQFIYNPQPQNDLYPQFPNNHSTYDHYNVAQHQHQQQQPSYPSLSYTNSPYAPQYQHARPSDVFGSTGNVDPALQSSSHFQHADRSFQAPSNSTVSPQYLQYGVTSNQQANLAVSSDFNQSANTMNPNNYNHHQDNAALYYNPNQNINVQQRPISNPLQYQTMPAEPQFDARQIAKRNADAEPPVNGSRPQPQVKAVQPANTLRTTRPELLGKRDTSSRPQMSYAPFVYFEEQPVQIPLGMKNTLPKYHPRKSTSGRELVPGFDLSQALTPARVSVKKEKVPKEPKIVSKYKGTSHGPKPANKVASLREEGIKSPNKSPSTPTETSSSEDESSSDEESEYEEDTVMDIKEIRGTQRPTDVAMATRYDAIGIVWKDPGSNPGSDVVKAAIESYGNFVIGLRTQLKQNSNDATARPADAAKLKQERQILLEQLYQAIQAANEHGYGPIVENLGGHQRLVNGLTTTLIECHRAEDYLGKLPRAVFALLAKFQTMTDDLLKKLKFSGIQKVWSKKADEQINKDIAAILANTTDAKEKASKTKKETQKVEEPKKAADKVELAKQRVAEVGKAPSSHPTKRPHDGEGATGKPAKKVASETTVTPALKPIPKRSNLLGITSKPVSKPAVKKREVSPPTESKLGALLASIAEPPKPAKTPEAPPRAPETPEEKARRERKESRRHLRVKFKDGPDLEEIRLFKHEQAEDEGRQDDMLRDAHDDRSEGMMHKRRVSDAMDEDDDDQPEWEDKPYPELALIDFSGLDKNTTFGPKYITRGGDLAFTTPEQEAQKQREALELMAIYTDLNDIPTSPKEPPVPPMSQVDGTEDGNPARQIKAPNVPWLSQRLQELERYGPYQAHRTFIQRMEAENKARGISSSPSANINSILQTLGRPAQQPTQQFVQPQHPSTSPETQALINLQRIIETLKGKPYPATEPPFWMTNEGQRADWWNGFTRDKAIKDHRQSEQASQYQPPPPSVVAPQPAQQMPVQAYQPPPPPNMASTAPMTDLNQQMQANYAAYANGGNPQYDYNAWVAAAQAYAAQQSQAQPQAPQPQWNENWNENASPNPNNESRDGGNLKGKSRGYELKEFKDVTKNSALFDENGEYKGKKKPCRFWKDGKCAKGAKCTYLHD